jgi:hypothetical protein
MVPRSTDAEFNDTSPTNPVELDEALQQLQFQMRGIRTFFGNPPPMPDDEHSDRDRERVMRDTLPAEIFGGFGGDEGSRAQRSEHDRNEYIGMYS